MARVLALDIATTSGWACDGPPDKHGQLRPVGGTFSAPGDMNELGRAYIRFAEHLTGLINLHQPAVLAFEAPLVLAHGGRTAVFTTQATTRKLFGLAAIAEYIATLRGLDVYELNVQQVRRHFLGSARPGNRVETKRAVMERCRSLGWAPASHDIADAMACWSYTKGCLRSGGIVAGPLYAAEAGR